VICAILQKFCFSLGVQFQALKRLLGNVYWAARCGGCKVWFLQPPETDDRLILWLTGVAQHG
jgi:hypothetical protein